MNEKETNTSKAQVLNIRAAKAIVETVRSTLGPMGMDKMMVDGAGNVIVTNDGATILRELDVAHPGARMMVEISKTQETLCYDGTTTTVVLAGQLLSNSETLFEKGLHPNVICRGYHEASQMALDYLLSDINNSDSESLLHEVAKTAITGKAVETSTDMVSALCVDAVMAAGDVDKVRVISLPGGSIEESYLFNGVIVGKDFVLDYDSDEETNVMLINTGLEEEKSDENVQVQLDADSYTQFKQAGKKNLLEQAQQIVMKMNGKGIVFVRDSVHDHVCAFLRKNGIGVVRRVPESTMRALKSALGLSVAQTPEEAETSATCKVSRQKHNDVYYLFVSGDVDSDQSTLVLRGATQSTLDEVERGFDDALGVVSLVKGSGQSVAGGGSSFVAMAVHLRAHAASIGGRAQMAIEAFADALEIVPATIAENAGYDSLDTVLAIRNKIQNGDLSYGPDVTNGGVKDMWEAGVVEPTALIKQAVLSATEVTTSILRIDDIVSRRPVE
jgi:chaperonin GroEL (HSP60 family)